MLYTCGDTALWHSIASMGLPAFTIHSIVKYSTLALKNTQLDPKIKVAIPVVLGLGSIPFIIHPLDHITDYLMDNTIRKLYHDKLVRNDHH